MSGSPSSSDRKFIHQFSLLIGCLLVLTVALIITARMIYQAQPKETDRTAQRQITARIAPDGAVYAGDTGRASILAAQQAAAQAAAAQVAYGGSTDGKTIYDQLCHSCHETGIGGAPKRGDHAEWAPRLAQGMETLLKHATDGFKAMPARGGNPSLNDEQVKAAVSWLSEQSK